METLEKAINFISANRYGSVVLEHIYKLDAFEIKIIIAVTALLFALLIYRRFGASIFWVLMFAYFIAYIIYQADFFNVYKDNNQNNEKRMRQIQEEIDKERNR